MSRKLGDINAKIAYLTNRNTGPILKTKRPLVVPNKPLKAFKKNKETPCLPELTALLECTSQYDDHSKCSEAYAVLLKCNENHKKTERKNMNKLMKGEKVGGQYHPKILSKLLNRYPEARSSEAYTLQRNQLNTYPESRRKPLPYHDEGRPFNKHSSQ